MILTILDDVAETFWKIIISLVGSIFKLVNSAYRIFLALAEADIFKNAEFDIITKNMYEILSIVMLFALAYGILVKIVDPENSKSGVDGKKILQKLVMAIVLLALIPSIFSFMFGLQEAILESNVLNSIFTGSSNVGAQNIQNAGNVMAVNSFKPFFTPNVNSDVNPEDARGSIKNHTEYGVTLDNQESYGCKKNECTLADVDTFAEKTGDFGFYQAFAANINEGEVDFQWLIALVVGGFLVYAMISFCFDMALRVCKLAFFEIIAPIAIFCNVIPKMEDVFKKWLSNTTKTFISVFTRIIVMNFGVYLISIIVKNVDLGLDNPGNWFLNLIAKCFLILGIVMFMRQAPKLLSDLFGFGDGDMKLGIKDKLKSSGAFAAGAAIGAGTTGLVRNAVNAGQNFKKAPKDKKFGAVVKGIGSTLAGGASGFTKGVWYAKDAGSGKDMKNALNKAADATVENRNKREAYKAAHPGFGGVQKGHIMDAVRSAGSYFGVDSLASLKKEKETADKMQGFYKTMASYVEDNEAVANFAGLYEAERKREISDTVFDEKNYMTALKDKYSQIMKDSKYNGMTAEQKKAIATSQVDKSNFVRKISSAEMARALQEKEANLKRLDSLKKLATVRAVNEKLNKKAADGTIIDSRFQAVVNEAKVFKQQNANYDFVQDMSEISGLTWDKSWNDIMYNNNNLSLADYNAAVDKLMSDMKAGTTGVKYFSDSENAKNHSGALSAEISKQIQKQQEGK